jgi:hypothetical protein
MLTVRSSHYPWHNLGQGTADSGSLVPASPSVETSQPHVLAGVGDSSSQRRLLVHRANPLGRRNFCKRGRSSFQSMRIVGPPTHSLFTHCIGRLCLPLSSGMVSHAKADFVMCYLSHDM